MSLSWKIEDLRWLWLNFQNACITFWTVSILHGYSTCNASRRSRPREYSIQQICCKGKQHETKPLEVKQFSLGYCLENITLSWQKLIWLLAPGRPKSPASFCWTSEGNYAWLTKVSNTNLLSLLRPHCRTRPSRKHLLPATPNSTSSLTEAGR